MKKYKKRKNILKRAIACLLMVITFLSMFRIDTSAGTIRIDYETDKKEITTNSSEKSLAFLEKKVL